MPWLRMSHSLAGRVAAGHVTMATRLSGRGMTPCRKTSGNSPTSPRSGPGRPGRGTAGHKAASQDSSPASRAAGTAAATPGTAAPATRLASRPRAATGADSTAATRAATAAPAQAPWDEQPRPDPQAGQADTAPPQRHQQPAKHAAAPQRPARRKQDEAPSWAEPDSIEAFSERWHRRGIDSRDEQR